MDKYYFYKIQSKDVNITDTYVGKTKNLKKRESYHKHTCNNQNSNYYNLKLYQFIRNNGGWNNFTLTEISNRDCTHEESSDFELYYYNLYNTTLNTNVSNRSRKEWYEDNKELVKQYQEENKTKKTNTKNSIKIKDVLITSTSTIVIIIKS